MAAPPFPALFKKTAFATFDPIISRIYTSTPSSISQKHDFGTKYPIQTKRGPRYIRLSNMDAGRLLGSDWRTAESDFRFIQAWGNGRVNWVNEDEGVRMRIRGPENIWDDRGRGGADGLSVKKNIGDEKIELLDDIDSMSPAEFKSYLGRVRKYRETYLMGKLGSLRGRTLEKLVLPEDRTLVTLGSKGFTVPGDTEIFQVGLAKQVEDDSTSRRINSNPHKVFGLSYSKLPTAATSVNPLLHVPGRALDRGTKEDFQNYRVRDRRMGDAGETNRPWVVSTGGLTGKTRTAGQIISDVPVMAEGVDYTRVDKSRGEARWKVVTASIRAPPQVLDVQNTANAQRIMARGRRISTAVKPKPMDTFKFDIQLDHTKTPVEGAQMGEGTLTPGTREWVGHEWKAKLYGEDLLGLGGLGGPRARRVQGEGYQRVRNWERARESEADEQVTKDTKKSIDSLFAKLREAQASAGEPSQ